MRVTFLKGPRGSAHKIVGLIDRDFKLDLNGKRDNIRLAHDRLWDDIPRLEGTSEGPQTFALRYVEYTAARLKFYRDELEFLR